MTDSIIKNYWNNFKEKNGIDSTLDYVEDFYFGYFEEHMMELLELVLEGKKTVTSSALFAYYIEGENIPKIGEYSIVTDFNKNIKCIIKTTNVRIIRFNEMTYEICKLEGEDKNLESWKEKYKKYLEYLCSKNNLKFNDNMELVFEEFEVMYKN